MPGVGFHGSGGDEQLPCNIGSALSGSVEAENFLLAGAEVIAGRQLVAALFETLPTPAALEKRLAFKEADAPFRFKFSLGEQEDRGCDHEYQHQADAGDLAQFFGGDGAVDEEGRAGASHHEDAHGLLQPEENDGGEVESLADIVEDEGDKHVHERGGGRDEKT